MHVKGLQQACSNMDTRLENRGGWEPRQRCGGARGVHLRLEHAGARAEEKGTDMWRGGGLMYRAARHDWVRGRMRAGARHVMGV